MIKNIHVIVSGRVQGVWYRGWIVQTALGLGLSGWVRNLSDGRVEAVFAGDSLIVDKMALMCRQGPPAARVDDVRIADWTDDVAPGFHQRPTA